MAPEERLVVGQPQHVTGPWLAIITVARDDDEGVMATSKSIAAQSLKGVEWIFVDGSSSPVESRLPEEVKAILRYFWAPPRGIYQAMNLGLSRAKAPHLLFLNAGDTLADADVLQALRPWCQAAQGSWLYGRTELIEPDGRKRLAPNFDFATEGRHRFRRGRFPQQPATLYATSKLRAIGGFDDRLTIAADYQAMLKLSMQQTPQFVDVTITRFKLDGKSSINWRASLSQALNARCEVYDLGGATLAWEWLMSRGIWMRSWLYRTIPKPARLKFHASST